MKDLPGSRQGAARFCVALLIVLALTAFRSSAATPQADTVKIPDGELKVIPIEHATFALQWNGKTILVDPVGGASRFSNLPKPDLVLVTDIHPDHLNKETLEGVVSAGTALVVSPAVAKELPESLRKQAKALANGERHQAAGVEIEAIPAYNLTAERLKFHPKGRGNGYVLTLGKTRVYTSGDTENIPEMLALKGIDVAFVCMNLPYTMTVEQAAEAVRAFKPKVVYPYHSRGSDVKKFAELVGKDAGTEVRIRNWYP
jgi:L-ascorbate metabolism protein UlaG (beta-lactamase superfamily)